MFEQASMRSPHGSRSDCYEPVRMGARGAVVANHPLAAEAGIRILAAGGNAVDAAVAVGFAIGVAEPNGSGIGGDGFIMVYDRKRGSVDVVNGTGGSPLMARPEGSIDSTGIRAASVPGIVDGMLLAHARWGRLPLATCIEPAIELCEIGVPVSHFQARMTHKYARLHDEPEAAKIFAPKGGKLAAGALRRNLDLATSYRLIAREGRDGFYRGPIAQAIVAFSEAAGGWFSKADFERHQARIDRPITTIYRGHHVFEAPPNSSGHVLLQELNILENFPVHEMPFLSPEAVHLMVEAKRLAFMDREAYLSDPDEVEIPLEGLLSKAYAAERARLIDPERALETVLAGDAWAFDPAGAGRHVPDDVRVREILDDTTHFCVVDDEGNAVGQLQSLNTMFGAQVVVPGTGIILNNRMTYWHLDPGHPNNFRPGARVRHTMNPAMVFASEPTPGIPLRWVLGTPGGDTQVQSNFQVISALLDHGLTEAEAVEAPRWCHHQDGTYSNHPHRVEESLTIEDRGHQDQLVAGLADRGHPVGAIGSWASRGSLGIIGVDPESGACLAAADPRRDGQALAF